jgi:hypothetical protein
VVIAAGVLIESVAADEFIVDEHVPPTTTRYMLPFKAAVAPVNVRVAVVAPE